MIGALAITLIPTLLFYLLLPKWGIKPKSNYLRISLSWFSGMYLFTIITFLLAIPLTWFTSSVLLKSSIQTLIIFLVLIIIYFRDDLKHLAKSIIPTLTSQLFLLNTLIILACFTFSFFFFSNQLQYTQGGIYISPVFWDFHWLMSLTQTFAFGDNIPPQNEAFSGLPANYHYFWMVITAIYEVLGLNLAQAINVISILGFFFILITIIGLSEEFFDSKIVGIITNLLAITSSSGHAWTYYLSQQKVSLTDMIKNILNNHKHPFYDAIYRENGFIYNGTFFNLFYFVEERQMILGIVYLLLCLWLISIRKQLTSKVLFIIGAVMGAYFLWHLYINLMILFALLFVLIFDNERKKTCIMLAGFGFVFLPHYLFFQQLSHSEWFDQAKIAGLPKFDPGFSDQRGVPFSFIHALKWYFYAYGLKSFIFPIGIIWLWFKKRKIAILISALVIPTFIVLNTIQLSPADIYENHKWLRPMNFFVDLTIAALFVRLFFLLPDKTSTKLRSNNDRLQRALFTLPLWILLLLCLTASGIMEIIPYFNSRPTYFFAFYPSAITSSIWTHTKPQTTFVGSDDSDIFLAGRKLFIANDFRGHDIALNRQKRVSLVHSLYAASNKQTFCNLAVSNNIDYVEFNERDNSLSQNFLQTLPNFTSFNLASEKVSFIDVKAACGK